MSQGIDDAVSRMADQLHPAGPKQRRYDNIRGQKGQASSLDPTERENYRSPSTRADEVARIKALDDDRSKA